MIIASKYFILYVKKNSSYLLLFASALLYATAFLYPHFFWWLVFVFPIPLFYTAIQNRITFLHGFFWGICTFSFHLFGVAQALTRMMHNSVFLGTTPIIFFIIVQSCIAGIFFYCTQKIIVKYSTCLFSALLFWSSTLFLFISYIDRYCLFFCGRCEGYAIINPLIPLIQHHTLLTLLPYLGSSIMIIFLLFFSATITLFFIQQTACHFLYLNVCTLFWIISFLLPNYQEQIPHFVAQMGVVPEIFVTTDSIKTLIQSVGKRVQSMVRKNPEKTILIFPESSLYCDELSTINVSLFWSEDFLGKKIDLIIGAFRKEDSRYFNCIYWFYDGIAQNYYNKQHSMVLTERIPTLFGPLVQQYYFKDFPERSAGTEPHPLFQLNKNCSVVPYICSELFFNEYPNDQYENYPILALCNDRWLPSYLQTIMYMIIQYKALLWRRQIVYVAFYHQFFCDIYGNITRVDSV